MRTIREGRVVLSCAAGTSASPAGILIRAKKTAATAPSLPSMTGEFIRLTAGFSEFGQSISFRRSALGKMLRWEKGDSCGEAPTAGYDDARRGITMRRPRKRSLCCTAHGAGNPSESSDIPAFSCGNDSTVTGLRTSAACRDFETTDLRACDEAGTEMGAVLHPRNYWWIWIRKLIGTT